YKVIDSQIRKVNIQDLKTFDGHVVPSKWFAASGINNNKSRQQDVYVATTFGLITGILSDKIPDNADADHGERQNEQGKTTVFNERVHSKAKTGKRHMTSLGQESPPNCPANSTFEDSISDIRNSTLAPAYKRRKIRQQSSVVMQDIIDVCNRHNETLANVVGECCSTDKNVLPL
ncbi:hypothetical protein QZH41_010262, partial [Actinostola sp. cb2023]